MTRTISWCCLWLLCCSVVSGCSRLSALLNIPAAKEAELSAQQEPELSAQQETELFAQGLDQYLESGDLKTLSLVPKRYPQGDWRFRAEGLIAVAKQQQQHTTQLQKKQQQFANCQTEKAFLIKDNQMLEVTLERLKQVLIDVETRVE